MPLNSTHRPFTTPYPPGLFDLLRLRFDDAVDLGLTEQEMHTPDGRVLIPLLHELADEGLCEVPPEIPQGPSVTVRINTVVNASGGGRVHVGGHFSLRCISRIGWSVTPNSRLFTNGMEFLRSRLPNASALGMALNRGSNWIGPADESWPELFDLQCEEIAAAFVSVWHRFRRHLGTSSRVANPRVAIRDVEVCRDLFRSDAIGAVLALRGTRPAGMRIASETDYIGDETTELSPVGAGIRWSPRPNKPCLILKAYAKRRDLLRLEVSASYGKGVKAVIEEVPQDTTRTVIMEQQPLAGLLRRVGHGAAKRLDGLANHVARVRTDAGNIVQFIAGLNPLSALLVPGPVRAGAPLSEATRILAGDTLRHLVRTGSVRPLTPAGKFVRADSPVRAALEIMRRRGIVTFRGGWGASYEVDEEFNGARAALAPGFTPTLDPPGLAAE